MICCELIEDIISWQLDPDEAEAARLFREVLIEILPDREHPFQLGPLGELLGWLGKLPTLITPDAERSVLFEFVSSGVRRMLALAYALVWAWVEHQRALRLTKRTATEAHQVVLLVDEIETHLQPKWRRRILPAILQGVKVLTGSDRPV